MLPLPADVIDLLDTASRRNVSRPASILGPEPFTAPVQWALPVQGISLRSSLNETMVASSPLFSSGFDVQTQPWYISAVQISSRNNSNSSYYSSVLPSLSLPTDAIAWSSLYLDALESLTVTASFAFPRVGSTGYSTTAFMSIAFALVEYSCVLIMCLLCTLVRSSGVFGCDLSFHFLSNVLRSAVAHAIPMEAFVMERATGSILRPYHFVLASFFFFQLSLMLSLIEQEPLLRPPTVKVVLSLPKVV
jgi:hypothetical protein